MVDQKISYQLEKYSVNVWIDIEKHIPREFNKVSTTTNSGYAKEYFQMLSDECRKHAYNLHTLSSLVKKEEIDPIVYIRYPVNVIKKFSEHLKNNSELINYLAFYSDILHQISETYMNLSKKTENINATIILKKMASEKIIQEGILTALTIQYSIT